MNLEEKKQNNNESKVLNKFKCYQCKIEQENKNNNFLEFSCGHKLCSLCYSHFFLLKDLKKYPNSIPSEFQINCICKNGVTYISLDKLKELFSYLENINEDSKCKKHNAKGVKYCNNCRAWLCDICLTIHNEIVDKHILLNKKIEQPRICNKHRDGEIKLYCKDCKKEICNFCTEINEEHYQHKVKSFLTYISNITKIKEKRIYQNYDDFKEKFQGISQKIINYYIKDYNKKLNECISMIDNLNQLVNQYTNFMEIKIENCRKLFDIISLAYKRYFEDEKIKYPNIFTLKFLSKFSNFIININYIGENTEEFDLLFEQISKYHNDTFFKINFEYTETKNKNKPRLSINSSLSNFKNINNKLIKKQKKYEMLLDTTLKGHSGPIYSLIELNDGRIVTGSKDKKIIIWDILLKKIDKILEGHSNTIYSLIQLRNGNLFSCSEDCTIKIWDLIDYKLIKNINIQYPIYCCLELFDLRIALGHNKLISIFRIQISKKDFELIGHEDKINKIIQLNENKIASSSYDGQIFIWDILEQNDSFVFSGHENIINDMININYSRIATCSDDKTIKFWDWKSKNYIFSLNGHKLGVLSLFLYNESQLLSCGKDCLCKIWDILKKREIFSIKAHNTNIYKIIRTKDGKIITSGIDVIKLWL